MRIDRRKTKIARKYSKPKPASYDFLGGSGEYWHELAEKSEQKFINRIIKTELKGY